MPTETAVLERNTGDGTRTGASCRFCGAALTQTLVDLGVQPLCQSHIAAERVNHMEPFYPLHAYVCDGCFLVQLEEYVAPQEIFGEYAYFSSYSESWLRHAKAYSEMAIGRFGIGAQSLVMEIASNDGYLLRNFVARGIPVLGIEPAANVAQAAIDQGVPTAVSFLGRKTAHEIIGTNGPADLVVANNVLAHVPTLNDFVAGIKVLLKPGGVATLEFPHLLRLIAGNQFDTIYHEHFSYFSLYTVERVFAAHAMVLFDVDELATHGGSLRIYARHAEDASKAVSPRIDSLRARELRDGVDRLATYASFEAKVKATKRGLLAFLIQAKGEGKSIVGYGAPGKGNTLLNYCGIREDFLDYTVDRNPYKQNKLTPGTRIPIRDPDRIRETRPDYVLILPWNLKDEIMDQAGYVRDWGGRFVVPIPEIRVYP